MTEKPEYLHEELKRCPFCGGEVTHRLGDMIEPTTVYCLNCPVAIPTKIWQSRPIEDELKVKIKELRN